MKRRLPPAVCIIVENEPVPRDWRAWQIARALTQAGYRVSVICPKDSDHVSSRETREGIEIYRHAVWTASGHGGYVWEYISALVAEFWLAWEVFAKRRFSVLHVCNPPDTTFLVALPFKLLGVRFVFDHHDLSPELYDSKFRKRGFFYRIVCLAEHFSFRFANISLATNESYREIAITRGNMNPDRVVVVQTCADLSDIERTEQRPELRSGKRHMVLYVGIMEPQDGLPLLLESIKHLVREKRRKDTHFVLVGTGSELPHLKKMSTQWGLEDFVEFTGFIPHEKVGSLLATADVGVAPDPLNPLNDKSTMIKILEYMAYSLPVVLYDLKEGRRTAGEAALYARPDDPVDFAEQVEKLLDSQSLRQKLGAIGRERTEQGLNWKAQSEKLIKAYATLFPRVPNGDSRNSSAEVGRLRLYL
jgi:glycosyltransferase involved in cell wall biosynthesis